MKEIFYHCLILYSEFAVFFSYPIVNSILCHLR